MDVTIEAGNGGVTMIGIFQVDPGRQRALLDVLKEGGRTLLSTMPGYVSNAFHASLDGHRVVLYAQWRSMEDLKTMRAHPDTGPYFKRLREIATFDVTVCTVDSVHHR